MTLKTKIQFRTGSTSAQWFFDLTQFMINDLGWTHLGSSDGSVIGGAGDNRWVNTGSANSTWAWMILESPHVSAADRIHIVIDHAGISPGGGFTNAGAYRYDPNANVIAAINLTTLPTSTSGTLITAVASQALTGGTNMRMHFVGDDASPYWLAAYCNEASLADTEKGAFGVFSLENQPSTPGKPYWIWGGDANTGFKVDALDNNSIPAGVAQKAGGGAEAAEISPCAVLVHSGSNTTIPNGILADQNGNDLSFPITIARDIAEYKGTLVEMRWTGVLRQALTTQNSKTRICLGHVTVPWLASTIPIP